VGRGRKNKAYSSPSRPGKKRGKQGTKNPGPNFPLLKGAKDSSKAGKGKNRVSSGSNYVVKEKKKREIARVYLKEDREGFSKKKRSERTDGHALRGF